jgi:exopolysaccharide biosynthesis polyprenyl glycosylphosphotransferase
MKRMMDVLGSALALAIFLPVFLVIAIAVKATSEGPVFFRQRRVGQHGNSFMFLKFRSMYANNDAQVHKQYVQQLIAGKADKHPSNGNGEGVYKMTKDSRITRVGAFLRKTSLDELPQFFNVLKGEMSLVGPRPPIPYEVEAYEIWHRRRLLEAKPGITGLWQISGRSRVKFDDMVRLDLQYARNWSPWMDIKILLRTPGAVVLGSGAH